MTVIEVAIGPGGVLGTFKVEVVTSPVGEASATVELDADALLARRGLLQQAVLASAVTSRRVLPETEQPVREVGQVLFAELLGAGEVAGRYRAAAAVAAMRGEGLRVVLRIDTPVLAALPWEAMYDQTVGAYVCRQNQLVRHVPVASVPTPLQVRPPLRILGVVSSPRGLPPLDVDKEQDQLARALARPVAQGLAELHWVPNATWADLQDLLLDGEWHILHFVGHGDFDPSQDEGVLALVREDGRADLIAAHRLIDLLRQARPMPRLVVLNSCSGATAGTDDLFSGTAAALVRGGISAVAAMQYEISDTAAVAFARGFYTAIAHGRGVDDAVSSGRVAILGLSDRTLEWVTPVLYLRGHDTHLFALRAPAEDANREGAQRDDADAVRGGQPGDATGPGAAGGPRGDSLANRPGARAPLGEPFQVVPSNRAPLGSIEPGVIWPGWQLVDRREGQVYQWPETLEHYDRYDVYRGETQEEGTVFISLGWAVRCGAWGTDRLYIVSFLSQRAPQTPLAEFLAADDYAETGELIAVIRGSDGGRRMYGPTEALPPAYAQFHIVTYRDRVQARGAWNKLAVVAAETDTDAILNHALIQARRRGDL